MDMGFSNESTQKLHDSIQRLLADDTWLEGNRVKHSLRGIFNLNLGNKAEYLDMGAGKNEAMASVMDEFNRFVNAGGKTEPTAAEIDAFCESLGDEHVRDLVGLTLRANLAGLDKYRPRQP